MKSMQESFRFSIDTMLRTETSFRHPINNRILHGILGIADESGELISLAKRTIYYKAPLDMTNLKEELGDMWFYYALILNEVARIEHKLEEQVFAEIVEMNRAKLKARYPDGYSNEAALDRDTTKEREILESEENKS